MSDSDKIKRKSINNTQPWLTIFCISPKPQWLPGWRSSIVNCHQSEVIESAASVLRVIGWVLHLLPINRYFLAAILLLIFFHPLVVLSLNSSQWEPRLPSYLPHSTLNHPAWLLPPLWRCR